MMLTRVCRAESGAHGGWCYTNAISINIYAYLLLLMCTPFKINDSASFLYIVRTHSGLSETISVDGTQNASEKITETDRAHDDYD